MPQSNVLRGSIDDLNRPYVKLTIAGFAEPLTAFIDTGFNGSLIVDRDQAQRMGFETTSQHYVSAVLASHRPEVFLLSRGRITWFGEQVFLSALVIQESDHERVTRRRRKRQEEIVLGVELLFNCRLEIDFSERSVLIKRLD